MFQNNARLKEMLSSHSVIAWDADQTLLDQKHSRMYAQFIRENQNKQHHIVTFRDDYADCHSELFSELRRYNLTSAHFHGVHFLPVPIYDCYRISRLEECYWESTSARWKLTVKEMLIYARSYLYWKGAMANKIGATVLIDDHIKNTEKGCEHFNVRLIDSINLKWAI